MTARATAAQNLATMLKHLKKLFSHDGNLPKRIPLSSHGIAKKDISPNALKVIEGLQKNGWEAYLVGGGVRDLLLNGEPKDFDIATNATPEDVQKVFRRAMIIGRRFKIVHVRFGREIIEVTTFRGTHKTANKKNQALQSDKGILLRDNVYGDLESDAYRRDFTINAMYYDPSSETIIDYTGAVDDLAQRRLRIIGDAVERYKEDPVRMLRAIRFQNKLALNIEAGTEAPIKDHAHYLGEIPPARLFEEVLKLFLSGYSAAVLEKLHEYGLLAYLFPSADRAFEHGSDIARELLRNAAVNTDKRIRQEKRVTPAFIYASMLWPTLKEEVKRLRADLRCGEQELMYQASHGVIAEQQQRTSIPKRFLTPMRDIWMLQLRLERRDPKKVFTILEHPKFRAGYDFLLLREQSGELAGQLGAWWTTFQFADKDTQTTMMSELKSGTNKRKRRRPRRQTETSNASDSPSKKPVSSDGEES